MGQKWASLPFSICGLNEEKHFQYCTMTALKYDKLLHYIQLYIIRDRPHYTPVGPLQEIILSIMPTTATFSTAGAYISLWLFLQVVLEHNNVWNQSCTAWCVKINSTEAYRNQCGLCWKISVHLGHIIHDGCAPGLEPASLHEQSINHKLIHVIDLLSGKHSIGD